MEIFFFFETNMEIFAVVATSRSLQERAKGGGIRAVCAVPWSIGLGLGLASAG